MKFSHITFHFTIWILSISILFTSCYSYYSIPNDDYSKIENLEDIKIVYTNGKEFVVEKNDTTNVHIVDDSLIVYKGTQKKIISMDEVEKIKESRFDLGGTITISLVALTILVVLFFSTFSFKT